MQFKGPKRIVCLTEEPTEILYLLGEQHRIVGISRYAVRPPEAKDNHPIVSAFVDGSVKKISELKPDLVIGFSDIQGDLAAKLIKANLQVLIFNQRSIEEILEVILTIGRIVAAEDKAQKLVDGYKKRLNLLREKSDKIQKLLKKHCQAVVKPKVTAPRKSLNVKKIPQIPQKTIENLVVFWVVIFASSQRGAVATGLRRRRLHGGGPRAAPLSCEKRDVTTPGSPYTGSDTP